MDYKQYWQGWERQWMPAEQRAAIMKARSYYDLNQILGEQAQRECETSDKPFYLGATSWAPGPVTPAHSHGDYMLEGQMRATKIHTTYFAYEKMIDRGSRDVSKVTDPALVRIVTVLNSLGGEVWSFTLALKPADIRSEQWQQHPVYKGIAAAFGSEGDDSSDSSSSDSSSSTVTISTYLDNLESIQKVYA